MQVDLRSSIKQDLQLQFGYTYSKAIDAATSNGSGGDLNNVTNPYAGWRYDVGPSPFDRSNVAFVNFVYSLPIFNGNQSRLLKGTLGGWQLSGIMTAETVAPLPIGVNGFQRLQPLQRKLSLHRAEIGPTSTAVFSSSEDRQRVV